MAEFSPRVLVLPLVAAFGAGAFAWLLGVQLGEAVLVASVVLAMAVGRARLPLDSGVAWPPLTSGRELSGRHDISWLAMEVAGREGRSTADASEYLGDLTRRRLARHGVKLSDHATAESLVGPLAYSVATQPLSIPLRHSEFEACVVALERLNNNPPTTGVS